MHCRLEYLRLNITLTVPIWIVFIAQTISLWRSLARIWPLSKENLYWSVGNGESIKASTDCWISERGLKGSLMIQLVTLRDVVEGQIFWLVLNGRILTNNEGCRRGFSNDPSCGCCGHLLGDALHVFQIVL